MRKWLISLLVIVLLLLCSVYLFIPGKLTISDITFVGVGQNTAYRCLTETDLSRRWLPDSNLKKQPENAFRFTITPAGMFNEAQALIQHQQQQLNSYMKIIGLPGDSSAIEWGTEMQVSPNPFKRLQQYYQATDIKKNMSAVLENFQHFLEKDEDIYGLKISPGLVTDTMLVTAKFRSPQHPATEEYYRPIQQLRNYIAANGAQATNYPMLHILALGSDGYETMVAIPVNKKLRDAGTISFKRMIPGNILITEVKGGITAINKGFEQLEYYAADHRLTPPAIPFQSLVTDRLAEKDTTRWITKLYYPVY